MLFPAHDLGQEHAVLFLAGDVEGLPDGFRISGIQQVGAFHQYVRDHQQHNVQTVLLTDGLHRGEEFLFPGHKTIGIQTGDLAHRQIVTANVKFLVVGADNGLSALILTGSGGENGLPQLFQRDIGNTGHPVGNVDIPLGAGGRFEHDRIRHDGGSPPF